MTGRRWEGAEMTGIRCAGLSTAPVMKPLQMVGTKVYIEPGRGRSGPPVSTDSTGGVRTQRPAGGRGSPHPPASHLGRPLYIASLSVRNLRSTYAAYGLVHGRP